MPIRSRTPEPVVILAWAEEVSVAQLAARVVAYAETKAPFTTFRFAAKYTASSPLADLPEEVLSLIANEVRQLAFPLWMERFGRRGRCLAGICTGSDHVGPAEATAIAASPKLHLNNRRVAGLIEITGWRRHNSNVTQHCKELADLAGRTRLGKAVRLFVRDFHAQPFFLIKTIRYCVGHGIMSFKSKAFLKIPIYELPIESFRQNGTADFFVHDSMDISRLGGLTEDQRLRLQRAATVLHLHPYNPNEIELIPGNHDVDFRPLPLKEDTDFESDTEESEGSNPESSGDEDIHYPYVQRDRKSEGHALASVSTAAGGAAALKPRLMFLGSGELEAPERR
ncbi:MAG: hypothetical protein Q9170_003366 [Blastenia crenularia]